MKIGNDIVEVSRFLELVGNKRFLDRVTTSKEQEHIFLLKDKQKQAERLAGKFSAKEAISKALGLGISEGVTFASIEILPNEKGAPQVFLYGEAKKLFEEQGLKEIEVSISNTSSHATAVCVLW